MSRDQAHDTLGRAVFARHFRAAARVVEITRERRLAAGEPRAYARGYPEEHARDAVPEQCVHGFRGIVEDAGDDELLVGAELAKDARRLGRVAVVCTCGANVSRGLAHAMEHA